MSIFGVLFGDAWDGYDDARRGIQPDYGSDEYWKGWWTAQRDGRMVAAAKITPLDAPDPPK